MKAPPFINDSLKVWKADLTFAFWQCGHLRRYADARAIVVATLDYGAPSAYTARRETYFDSTAASGMRPLTIIAE